MIARTSRRRSAMSVEVPQAEPDPIYQVVLTGLRQGEDYRIIVDYGRPHHDRVLSHDGRDYEFVGIEDGQRVYRDQTR